ncbi:MAG: hypothetical protein SP1CHLAM54_11270 [Chlamydiia bacterium]|nr:hypothetical protein [Chlamydiia bacterium]MCH9616030.1 hypothetical protein [Chlamydiia bacterium]MCH9629053.1 hypothetical protein [Chlamydiia bacterium]
MHCLPQKYVSLTLTLPNYPALPPKFPFAGDFESFLLLQTKANTSWGNGPNMVCFWPWQVSIFKINL